MEKNASKYVKLVFGDLATSDLNWPDIKTAWVTSLVLVTIYLKYNLPFVDTYVIFMILGAVEIFLLGRSCSARSLDMVNVGHLGT